MYIYAYKYTYVRRKKVMGKDIPKLKYWAVKTFLLHIRSYVRMYAKLMRRIKLNDSSKLSTLAHLK